MAGLCEDDNEPPGFLKPNRDGCDNVRTTTELTILRHTRHIIWALGGVQVISGALDSIVFYTHIRFIDKQMGPQYGGCCSAIGCNAEMRERKKLLKDIPPEPRRLGVASFRLNTGHDILGKHLNRLGILLSASFTLCHQQEDMERQHLAKCPALKSSKEVDRY
ncbi:hypothetical protein ANN_05899 [Periplaneta americana]|uniref:Uncharacterized protein n=1 Tax=Periplaneta americana TaxID=6978 RepID=A0ABQ8TE27_PERAM|nr:hypothetical protein ANN_05899 [Periplaneta americana]